MATVREATEHDIDGSEIAENSCSGRLSNSLEWGGAFVDMGPVHGLAMYGTASTWTSNLKVWRSSFLADAERETWCHAGLGSLGTEEERRGRRKEVVVVPMASRLGHSS